jgi:predicted Fe-S protein YdhL (DUF1289 family)
MIRYPVSPFGSAAGEGQGVASPCINVCELDQSGLCIGCLRTTEEIAAWPVMDAVARRVLLETLEGRRRAGRTGGQDVEISG